MNTNEPKGVLPQSNIFFHTPSTFAKKALFFYTHLGEAFCDTTYIVNRQHFDSYLLIFILGGSMKIHSNSQWFQAKANDIILLDCYKPHIYEALEHLHFYFIHFDGPGAKAYFDLLYENLGNVYSIPENSNTKHQIIAIFNSLLLQSPSIFNEEDFSITIHSLLTLLSSKNTESERKITSRVVKESICFIEQNVSENISVKDIADHVNLDTCYFSKIFKIHTHVTPHAYLNNFRVDFAKRLLVMSPNLTVENISSQCGFENTTSFYRVFKRITGYPPSIFRDLFL